MAPAASKHSSREAETFLITSALPYANGDIHLGHLVETIQTDIYVRYQRMRGNKVVYVCADDTHGTPIELSAIKQGITPEELIADTWQRHVNDYAGFDIGFDIFYSTNSPENRHYAELIFDSLRKRGLIVEKEIEQFFCEHDKRFLPDRFIVGTCPRCGAADQYGDVCESCGATYQPSELVEPRCILCSHKPVPKTSTHLFVDLARREAFLREYVNDSNVLQQDMKNFVNRWIDEGLRDWCISRDGPYFGFEIPGYKNKYFYVWLDAPIGYVSSTAKWCAENDQRVEDYWGAGSKTKVVHFIGKDIVYFHALFWPVMLNSADLNLPSRFFIHGFLTVQGEKMSKTRGTFILARDYLEKIKHPQRAQCLRFYYAAKLASHAGDIDLNCEDFCSRVNATLANNVGNLHHRTFVFAQRYFDGTIPDVQWDGAVAETVREAGERIAKAYERVDYKSVVEEIHALGNLGNKYYQDNKPWELVKADREAAGRVITTCANLVRALAVFLKPIVPDISALIETQFGSELAWEDHYFALKGRPVGTIKKLVKPIEVAEFVPLLGELAQGGGGTPGKQRKEESQMIDIEQFGAVDLRVATIVQAEKIAKSDKLLKLQVELDGGTRQLIAGLAQHYAPETLVGRRVVVVANLKPATLMGEKSEGMVLAAQDGDRLVLLRPDNDVAPGSKIS